MRKEALNTGFKELVFR